MANFIEVRIGTESVFVKNTAENRALLTAVKQLEESGARELTATRVRDMAADTCGPISIESAKVFLKQLFEPQTA